MLSERIMTNPKGFKVLPGSEGKYELYCGQFTLQDEPGVEPSLESMSYWELPEAYEKAIDHDCYFYVVEKEDGKTIESCRFFFRSGNRKPSLSWSIEKMGWTRRFEPGAHEIVIRWNNSKGEPIRSEYIYLYPRNKPDERYQFLSDFIRPIENDGDDAIDRYVFFPGDGLTAEDFCIGFDPLLREKYNIGN